MSLTRQLHEVNLAAMKGVLNLGELALGKSTNAYLTYKQVAMEEFRKQGEQTGNILIGLKLAEHCPCGATLAPLPRNGPRWSNCPDCGGSGFRPIGGDDGTSE